MLTTLQLPARANLLRGVAAKARDRDIAALLVEKAERLEAESMAATSQLSMV